MNCKQRRRLTFQSERRRSTRIEIANAKTAGEDDCRMRKRQRSECLSRPENKRSTGELESSGARWQREGPPERQKRDKIETMSENIARWATIMERSACIHDE